MTISLCPNCLCMTKTINGHCGKCGLKKGGEEMKEEITEMINDKIGDFIEFLPILLPGIIIIGFIAMLLMADFIVRPKIKAKLINEKYGTSYTAWDMLFADEIIKDVVIGTSHNINIADGGKK